MALIKLPESDQFIFTTPIGSAQKVFNIRRNSHVSILFSNPTGSELEDPPYVLVQGDAEAPDEIQTGIAGTKEQLVNIAKRGPGGSMFSSNPLMRYLMDWYYIRIFIYVTPRRVYWWDHGDFTREPSMMVISDVG